MPSSLRYLLMQIRNSNDPMRQHEVECFARVLRCKPEQIGVFDLLRFAPTRRQLDEVDMLLLGGSGHYSAAGQGEWIQRALDGLRLVHDLGKPTFASCWGFQAMARAMGGRVIHDPPHAELGTHELTLTPAGRLDPIFSPLGRVFRGQMGHEDCVVQLPQDATLLASTDLVENQAYRFNGKPIYCTQFHPELRKADLLERLRTYPEYVQRIAGLTVENFAELCEDTPESESILRRFVRHVFGK